MWSLFESIENSFFVFGSYSGLAPKIIKAITDAKFEITAIQMFHLERICAEEFLEVYKGVVPEYLSMVTELSSGPCVAIALRAKDAPTAFREMAGPADPVSYFSSLLF